jgi:uncharacterized protein
MGEPMMRITTPVFAVAVAVAVAAVALTAPFFAHAVTSDIPATGLPSATDYSQTLLPERAGVVSWRTLAQVQPVKQNGRMVAEFSKEILGLDNKDVRVQGFIIPLDIGDKQKRFLLTAVPPHCAFCLPAGPDGVVEVVTKTPVKYGFEAIVVSGRFAVLKDDPTGVLYRLTDAESIDAPTPAPAAAKTR